MKANLFLNGSFCDYSHFIDKTLFTLAADAGVINALRNGCTPDAVLGDGDSLHEVSLEYRPQIKEIPFIDAPDQEFTDFEKSLQFLNDEGYTDITVYCFQGERTDHMLAGLSAVSKYPELEIKLYSGKQLIYKLPLVSKLISHKNQILSLIPYPKAQGVETHGLEWDLTGQTLELGGYISISNRALGKDISINYKSGRLYIIRPI